jgi:hypothetical protein
MLLGNQLHLPQRLIALALLVAAQGRFHVLLELEKLVAVHPPKVDAF